MRETTRETLLYGVIGGLSFLVLGQGYGLVTSERLDLVVLFGVALLVAAVTVALVGLVRRRSERD